MGRARNSSGRFFFVPFVTTVTLFSWRHRPDWLWNIQRLWRTARLRNKSVLKCMFGSESSTSDTKKCKIHTMLLFYIYALKHAPISNIEYFSCQKFKWQFGFRSGWINYTATTVPIPFLMNNLDMVVFSRAQLSIDHSIWKYRNAQAYWISRFR